MPPRVRLLVLAAACAAPLLRGAAADQPSLTSGEIRQFLRSADVVKSRSLGKDVTGRHRQLLANWHQADADLPELKEARRYGSARR